MSAVKTLAFIFVALVPFARAEDKLISLVIPTGPDMHVFEVSDGEKKKQKLAAPFGEALEALGRDTIYNFREVVADQGVELSEQEIALYSPESELIFVRATPDHAGLIETLFHECDHSFTGYDANIEILRKSEAGQKPGSPEAVFRFATLSGGSSDIAVRDSLKGKVERKLTFEFIVGPDGKEIDVNTSGEIPLIEENISLRLRTVGEIEKPLQ